MPDFLSPHADALEAEIRANRLFNLPDAYVFPHFKGLSIVNTAQSVLDILGIESDSPLDPRVFEGADLNGIDRIVLFLTDGLSYLLLRDFAAAYANLRENIQTITQGRGFLPLTSISPSTTVAALMSYWTGVPPGEHGVVGTFINLPEYGGIVNMLFSRTVPDRHSVVIDRDTFLTVPSVAQMLTANGIESHLIIGDNLTDTSLSRLLYRGVTHFHGYQTSRDMSTTIWQQLSATLTATRGKRAYISAYLPTVDTLCHIHGATSSQVQSEVRYQFSNLARIIASARTLDAMRDGKTLFIITADHGHLSVDKKIRLHDNIRAALRTRTISNDPRMASLHLLPHTLAAVKAELDTHHSDTLFWIESKDAIEAGLFGTRNLHPKLHERLGDLLLYARDGYIFDDPLIHMDMNGMHTGLHEIEMLVPFMFTRF